MTEVTADKGLTYCGHNGDEVDQEGQPNLPDVLWEPSIDRITLQKKHQMLCNRQDTNPQKALEAKAEAMHMTAHPVLQCETVQIAAPGI